MTALICSTCGAILRTGDRLVLLPRGRLAHAVCRARLPLAEKRPAVRKRVIQ